MLFVLAFACNDDGNNGGSFDDKTNPPLIETNSDSNIYGTWAYTQSESRGSTTSMSGNLELNSDGSFEDKSYIGGNHAWSRRGTFSVSGNQLTITDERSGGSQTFRFYIGSAQDAAGEEFTSLTLKGNELSYLLTRKE